MVDDQAYTEQTLEPQKSQLEELALYLQTDAIQRVIQDMKNEVDKSYVLCDSQQLSKLFHQHGVNNRYLGLVYGKIRESEESTYPNLLLFLEKVILVRSLKHVFRRSMRKLHDEGQSESIRQVLAHLFNCIFAS